MKLSFLLLACVACLFIECNTEKLNAMQKTIKEAHVVRLYQIDYTPTLPQEQKNTSAYICNYKITDEVLLTQENIQRLKKAVLDSTNYIMDIQKKCMMRPSHAIYFQTETDTLEMVVSINNCPKTIIKHSSDNEKIQLDLIEDSAIRKVLDNLIK